MENIIFDFENHFTPIYEQNVWGGSGSGSFPENTVSYRQFLQDFLIKNNIKTIIDYGCGDWQSSKFIDWSSYQYLGIDCVSSVIESNTNAYKSNNVQFMHISSLEEFFTHKADLLIIKDVLQHWINNEIVFFLEKIKSNFKYILITNSSDQKTDWQDEPYRSRPLSCDFYPLKQFCAKKKAVITNNAGNKEISLITLI